VLSDWQNAISDVASVTVTKQWKAIPTVNIETCSSDTLFQGNRSITLSVMERPAGLALKHRMFCINHRMPMIFKKRFRHCHKNTKNVERVIQTNVRFLVFDLLGEKLNKMY
jgi:hypothetical protein